MSANAPRNPRLPLKAHSLPAAGSATAPPPPPSITDHFNPGVNDPIVLIVALLVSLLMHGTLAWTIHNRSLGSVDPNLLNDAERRFLVQRAEEDLIEMPEPPRPEPTADGAGARELADLRDLSLALLAARSQAAEEGLPAPASRDVDLRTIDEPPDASAGQLQEGLVEVRLPDTVMDLLKGRLSFELPFKEDPAGAGGTDEATTDNGQGGGDADAAAAALLASGGGDVGRNPEPRGLSRPRFADTAPPGGFSPVRPPPAPELDFMGLALGDTTKLPIPEHLDNDFDYAVTRFEPPKEPDDAALAGRGYFRIDITGKRSLRKLKTMPKDVVFLVDTSGSVPQPWVKAVAQGVRDALGSLNEGDRFNIVLFSDKPAFFSADGIAPATPENIAKAQQFMNTAQSAGYTDVNQALARLMVRDVAVERVYDLVLISDGTPTKGVLDTRELINLITRDNDLAASIYCVGVGPKQNRELLDFLAYRNKGFCVFASTVEQTPGVVRDLLSRLRYPIMKDIRVAALGVDDERLFPRDLPNIHQGEIFSMFGRYHAPAGGKKFTMRFTGHNGAQLYDFSFTRELGEAYEGTPEVARGWGFVKLHHLYSELLRRGMSDELKREMDRLRKEYGFKTLY